MSFRRGVVHTDGNFVATLAKVLAMPRRPIGRAHRVRPCKVLEFGRWPGSGGAANPHKF
jgi:hypothetical protein